MPIKGYKTLTVPEELYERIKKETKKRGLRSPAQLLRELVEGAREGQGLATVPPPSSSGGKGGRSRLVEEGEG